MQDTSEADASASVPPAVADEPEDVEERQNFASSKDGAKIVAVNREAKKATSLLDNDGDTFLKNECKAEKWVIIDLAQVVNVDEIKVNISVHNASVRLVSGPSQSRLCWLSPPGRSTHNVGVLS